jgi:glycosyltransferase involved in cell wall biosynthesis
MKVIFIITFSPPYEEYANKSKPQWNWDTPNGSWVGIWGYDWGDLIGKSLVKYSDKVEYEVWQVDERADKIYTAELDERVIHKNFPAQRKGHFSGLKRGEYIFSKLVIEYARVFNNQNVIFMLPSTVISPFIETLVKSIDNANIIYYNLISTSLLLPTIEYCFNPLRLLHRYLLRRRNLQHIKTIKHLLTLNDHPHALQNLKMEFGHIKEYLFKIGMDFEYWKQDKTVEDARKLLSIPLNKFVIFLSQRLIPGYQIDKFIQAIFRINSKRDFVCYISGHGGRDYEQHLKELVRKYNIEDLIRFVGYVSDEDLKNYFIACDVFATVPKITAGSNSAKKAMAFEKPIVHITQGDTYEYLKENRAGVFLNPTDYDQWTKVFKEVIEGEKIETIPREEVVDYFSWEATAREILYALENAKK